MESANTHTQYEKKHRWYSLKGSTLIMIGLGILGALGPLLFIPVKGFSVLMGKGFLMMIITGILGILISIMILRKGSITVPKHPIIIGLGLVILSGLLGTVFSPSWRTSLIGYGFETTTVVFTIGFALVIYTASQIIKTFQQVAWVLLGIVGTFGLLAVIHAIRFITGPETANLFVLWTTTSTLAGSWFDLGILSGIVLLFAMVTAELVPKKHLLQKFIIILGAIATVFLFIMNIRLIWVVVGLMALFFVIYLFSFVYWDSARSSTNQTTRIPWYALSVFFIAVAAILFGGALSSFTARHEALPFQDIRPSLIVSKDVAKESIARNIAFGYGPNTFGSVWQKVKPKTLSGTSVAAIDFNFGASYFVTQLATLGIIGIMTWCFLAVLVGLLIFRFFFFHFQSPGDRYLGSALALITGFIGLMGVIHIPGVGMMMMFAVLIGAMMGILQGQGSIKELTYSFVRDPRSSFFGIVIATACILASIFWVYGEIRKISSFIHFNKGQQLLFVGDGDNANRQLLLAGVLARHDLYYRQLAVVALDTINEIVTSTASDQTIKVQQALGTALGYAQSSVQINPMDYKNWVLLGNVYRFMVTLGISDAAGDAQKAYQEAAYRNPNDTTMGLYFAQLALAQKDSKGAVDLINKSIAQYPTSDAYISRAQIEVNQNKITEATNSLIQATVYNPTNAALMYQLGLLFYSQNRFTEAAQAFDRTIMIDKSFGEAYLYLGVTYEKLGRVQDAKKVYDYVRSKNKDAAKIIEKMRSTTPPSVIPEIQTGDTSSVVPNPKSQSTKSVAPTKKK